jgi:putative transcriptional regulator
VIEDIGGYDSRLYVGGPVQPDTLHFVHTIKELEGSKEILPGVFWGGDFEQLKGMSRDNSLGTMSLKFFIGYSGWGQSQLEEEIAQNSWIVADIKAENIFSEYDEDFWKEMVRSLGNKFAHIANFPENPFLN